MRTRPATIATIVIALGLALTTIGIGRGLPYTFAGHGDVSAIPGDLWAHGTAVSPALVALVAIGLLAAIAIRPTRGGRRAAAWLSVLAIAVSLAGLAEPAQQQALLLGTIEAVSLFAWSFHVALVALVLSCIGEARRPITGTLGLDEAAIRSGGEPVAAGRVVTVPGFAGAAA
jgi:hypothetical protein